MRDYYNNYYLLGRVKAIKTYKNKFVYNCKVEIRVQKKNKSFYSFFVSCHLKELNKMNILKLFIYCRLLAEIISLKLMFLFLYLTVLFSGLKRIALLGQLCVQPRQPTQSLSKSTVVVT